MTIHIHFVLSQIRNLSTERVIYTRLLFFFFFFTLLFILMLNCATECSSAVILVHALSD